MNYVTVCRLRELAACRCLGGCDKKTKVNTDTGSVVSFLNEHKQRGMIFFVAFRSFGEAFFVKASAGGFQRMSCIKRVISSHYSQNRSKSVAIIQYLMLRVP